MRWFPVRYTRSSTCGSLLGRRRTLYPDRDHRARRSRHARPHRHHLRRVRLHRPLRRPAHGARRLAGAGGGAPARTRRISSAPTASSARSSRSRPTSATRPRPARAIAGADAVVNCVGILAESRQADLRGGDRRGRRPDRPDRRRGGRRAGSSTSRRSAPTRRATASTPRAKGRGEAAVRAAFPGAVILRPSIVFGTEDELLQPLRRAWRGCRRCCRWSAPDTRFQPVYVDDVAAAAVAGGDHGDVAPGVYELGGPEVADLPRADAAACSRSSGAAG